MAVLEASVLITNGSEKLSRASTGALVIAGLSYSNANWDSGVQVNASLHNKPVSGAAMAA